MLIGRLSERMGIMESRTLATPVGEFKSVIFPRRMGRITTKSCDFENPNIPEAANYKGFMNAASLGFEPRQRDSESLVLPLHYEARVSEQLKASYTRAQPLRHSRKNLTLVENVEIRMTKLEGMTNA